MPTLRELGNEHFKAGQYKDAEQLYTQAIQHDPSDVRILPNRALSRLKLNDWRGAESDSRAAIESIGQDNTRAMKSYYNLAQALAGLKRLPEALDMAKKAYDMALATMDRSTEILSMYVLQLKKEIWQQKETNRLREEDATLKLMEELLDQRRDQLLQDLEERYESGEIGQIGRDEESKEIQEDYKRRISDLRERFRDSSRPETQQRDVPEYLIDSMTFNIMHDPVITPSGASYERSTLVKYLRDNPHDPLTREPLTERELIPNRALRDCADAFLAENGWAVDY